MGITATSDVHYLGQEDCLYLTVHTPPSAQLSATSASKLPVMFWIYGGAFVLGDSYEFGWYDAKNFVQKNNVIVVAVNYRVSSFGFLAHQALKEEDGEGNLLTRQPALVHSLITFFLKRGTAM